MFIKRLKLKIQFEKDYNENFVQNSVQCIEVYCVQELQTAIY